MLPTSFKFRVNSYIKTDVSKTQENSRLKTRYLKGITIEQLFIISILRDCLQSPFYFIQLLKQIKQTGHTLFILFSFLDHTLSLYIFVKITFTLFLVIHFFLIYIKQTKNNKRKEILI